MLRWASTRLSQGGESSLNDNIDESKRKEVFRMLVSLQDRGETVEDSRKQVAAYFGIILTELGRIEREGLDRQWPPL
jgi:hypothetical protein